MKSVRIGLLILLVVFAGIQFIPAKRNLSDEIPTADFMAVYDVPERIESILKTACYDCHSDNTYYPWYSKIQPVAWFLGDHIEEGKAELNFNAFGNYSDRRKTSKLRSIKSQVEEGKMPLASYTWMHENAKLSEADKNTLITWVNELMDN
ncbi:heme-binding domain-containing protein [Parapedobacter tibetensis]|uniref:heme-binding domain-containing protein n=1 Tax=Parapedobacter tibetensis TaxID=2972951 RepID=UPI00214D28F9|nr:heme-binding domain-containing protein [Parapedobacter tibetensis]